jgi:hypothetical protein
MQNFVDMVSIFGDNVNYEIHSQVIRGQDQACSRPE